VKCKEWLLTCPSPLDHAANPPTSSQQPFLKSNSINKVLLLNNIFLPISLWNYFPWVCEPRVTTHQQNQIALLPTTSFHHTNQELEHQKDLASEISVFLISVTNMTLLETSASVFELMWDIAVALFIIRIAFVYSTLTFISSCALTYLRFFTQRVHQPSQLPFLPAQPPHKQCHLSPTDSVLWDP
jgi:hypothetical protein